jgi:hypothetical protein
VEHLGRHQLRRQSVLVFLAHNAMDFDKAARGIGLGVYEAIAHFHAAAAR